jgi:hypothetical protein
MHTYVIIREIGHTLAARIMKYNITTTLTFFSLRTVTSSNIKKLTLNLYTSTYTNTVPILFCQGMDPDPDPHSVFRLDPDPHKRMRIRNTTCGVRWRVARRGRIFLFLGDGERGMVFGLIQTDPCRDKEGDYK